MGFKAQAEKSAAEAREALGVPRIGKLDPWAYAEHLKVILLDFHKLGLTEAMPVFSKLLRRRLGNPTPRLCPGLAVYLDSLRVCG